MKEIKVSVVLGNSKLRSNSLARFETLANSMDLCFHLSDQNQQLNSLTSSSKFFVYPDIADMPGYLRGLDEQISNVNIIFIHESTNLASFQALRVAKRFGIPVIAFVDEYRPLFYSKWQNIRAIQADIFQNADFFVASSKSAATLLNLEGVTDTKIKTLHPTIDTDGLYFNLARRTKFRSYLSISPDEFLIGVFKPLETSSRLVDIFLAAKLMEKSHPEEFKKCKWLIIGQGDETEARSIKVDAYKMGLGNKFLFLSQDTLAFMKDLVNGLDHITKLKSIDPSNHELFPFHILELLANGGSVSISPGLQVTDQIKALNCDSCILPVDDYQELVKHWVGEINKSKHSSNEIRTTRSNLISKLIKEQGEEYTAALQKLALEHYKKNSSHPNFQTASAHNILQLFKEQKYDECLVLIENALADTHLSSKNRSEALRIKGEIAMKQGNLEAALDYLNSSIQSDSENYASFRCLGYLSLQSHAHEEAVSFFKRTLSHIPHDEKSMMGVGIVYRRLGLEDESILWFEKAVLQTPDDQKNMHQYIQACTNSRYPKVAIESINRVMDIIGEDPKLVSLHAALSAKFANAVS